MLGVFLSMTVNGFMNKRGHDEEIIMRKKLPFLEGEAPHELEHPEARSLCDPSLDTILTKTTSLATVRHALDEAQGKEINYFPIRDGENGPCIGIISRVHLQAVLRAATP